MAAVPRGDWAAKGTKLLGVKAVIAESFERIHRSNLVGMGVLPLEFLDGDNFEKLGLDMTSQFTINKVNVNDKKVTIMTTKIIHHLNLRLRFELILQWNGIILQMTVS